MTKFTRLYGWPISEMEGVRLLLRDPEKQWKAGRSAMELARSWLGCDADQIPATVRAVIDLAPDWSGSQLTAGFFEHPTYLDTWRGPSQTDLMLILRRSDGLGVVAVEGKAGESFGPLVGEWNTSQGRADRLDWACQMFGIHPDECATLRWQLFHRTAAAVLEAERFASRHAMLLVHDFSGVESGVADFLAFAKALGISDGGVGRISAPVQVGNVSLRVAWVRDNSWQESEAVVSPLA